jgi:hypothetical protein
MKIVLRALASILLACAAIAAAVTVPAGASPAPYHQAQRACVKLDGGFISDFPYGYGCNFGGSPPARADKQWFGPTYQKICERYGGWIYEEYPPPYSYHCTIPAS